MNFSGLNLNLNLNKNLQRHFPENQKYSIAGGNCKAWHPFAF